MRLLIADDERMVRLTLKSMLLDLGIASDSIYEAKNGEEFIKSIKEITPDIAFVDIKMPKLNGLKAIKQSQSFSPDTKWIILTGFSEFDYAKQAIELGVSEYLLKPISPETLQKTMDKLFNNIHNNIISANRKFKKDIIALYYDSNSIKVKNLDPIITNGKSIILVFYFDCCSTENTDVNNIKDFFKTLESHIDKFLSKDVRIALFNKANKQIIAVCSYNENDSLRSKSIVNNYLNKSKELAKNYTNSSFSITTIQSEKFTSYKHYEKTLNVLNELSILRCILGINKDHNQKYLKTFEENDVYYRLSSLIIELCDCYTNRKLLEFNNILKYIENEFYTSRLLENRKAIDSILRFLNYRLNLKTTNIKNIDELIVFLNNHAEMIIKAESPNKSAYIEEIKVFIDKNYMKDIGINTIAETLDLTPNYLSTLFRKKTGVKFTDYITEVRMSKAKKLLAETDMTVNEVSESVGYYSSSYFTKIFFRSIKCYPSEYRKRFR